MDTLIKRAAKLMQTKRESETADFLAKMKQAAEALGLDFDDLLKPRQFIRAKKGRSAA